MAAKDKYHHIVCEALVKDGWTITDDPLQFKVEGRNVIIDLGAEKLIGAEKMGEKIAVEIKSFTGSSEIYQLYGALGQFGFYDLALEVEQPYRTLFLAVPSDVYNTIFQESLVKKLIQKMRIKLLIYNILEENITLWIK